MGNSFTIQETAPESPPETAPESTKKTTHESTPASTEKTIQESTKGAPEITLLSKKLQLEREVKSLESQVRYYERKARQLQEQLAERHQFFDHLQAHAQCIEKRLGKTHSRRLLITRVLHYVEDCLTLSTNQ
jgi:hypothetical protein